MDTFQGLKSEDVELTLDLTAAEFEQIRSIALARGMEIKRFSECAIKTALARRFKPRNEIDAPICQFLRAKDRS